MDKHPYHHLVAILRKKRTVLIGEFRHFKRNTIVRKWLDHSSFSLTVNKFRREIAEIDKLIAGGRLAIHVSKETGVTHWFDYLSNSVYSGHIPPSEWTAK